MGVCLLERVSVRLLKCACVCVCLLCMNIRLRVRVRLRMGATFYVNVCRCVAGKADYS